MYVSALHVLLWCCCCSDLPSIFSGRGIGFIDPHEQFFKTDGARPHPTSSHMWDFIADRTEIARLEDQFAPFIQPLFGVTADTFETGYFNGTIFRFPLRMEAAQSDLCQTVYSPQKVKDLFHSLEADAHILLLFLNRLKSIEVYEKMSNDMAPTLLMTVKISQSTEEEVTAKRAELIEQIDKWQTGSIQTPVSVIYNMTTELIQHQHPETDVTTRSWIISQFYGCDADMSSAKKSSNSLHLLPWVAVAIPVQSDDFRDRPRGHIFCFLPLPCEPESPTGLRVHVHGYFAVDQNRRHIKRRTAEQMNEKITDEAILWNEYLICCLLPKALVSLAQYIAKSWSVENAVLHRNLIYSVIPDMTAVSVHWQPLAVNFFQQLPQLPVFYSPVNQGRFLQMKDVWFDDIEAIDSLTELIRRILLQNQTDFVSVPSYILQQLGPSAARVPARPVCTALKNVDSGSLLLKDNERMLLLRYLVDGMGSNMEDLVGAKLLPLADESWTEFKQSTDNDYIYIDSSEHKRLLLPGLDKQFVRSDAVDLCNRIMTSAKPGKTKLYYCMFAAVFFLS